jgi:hypothetical protein
MAKPTPDEVARSDAARPLVQDRIDREFSSISAAARHMGSNPETVRQFLSERAATGDNLLMFERWGVGGKARSNGTRDTRALVDASPNEAAFIERIHAILADQSIPPRDRVMLIDAAAGAWTRVVLYRGELNVGGRNAVLQAAEDGGNGRTELLREREPTSPAAEVVRVKDGEAEKSKEATN